MLAERDRRLEELLAKVRASGGRVTGPRVTILRALLGGHRSAEEIYAEAKRANPSISRGTVYKTLEALKSLGEVKELEVGAGRAHFDGLRAESHPHAICSVCGKIEDVDLSSFAALCAEAAERGLEVRLDLFGPCAACRTAALAAV